MPSGDSQGFFLGGRLADDDATISRIRWLGGIAKHPWKVHFLLAKQKARAKQSSCQTIVEAELFGCLHVVALLSGIVLALLSSWLVREEALRMRSAAT
jgi:hypothetical protein